MGNAKKYAVVAEGWSGGRDGVLMGGIAARDKKQAVLKFAETLSFRKLTEVFGVEVLEDARQEAKS